MELEISPEGQLSQPLDSVLLLLAFSINILHLAPWQLMPTKARLGGLPRGTLREIMVLTGLCVCLLQLSL